MPRLWTAVSLPFLLLPLLAGTLAGAFWGCIAGVMKVRFGTNEVISTLLLGFVALLMVYWCVQSTALLRQPQTSSSTLPESLPIPDATKLPGLTGDPSSPMHIGVILCVLLALATGTLLALWQARAARARHSAASASRPSSSSTSA